VVERVVEVDLDFDLGDATRDDEIDADHATILDRCSDDWVNWSTTAAAVIPIFWPDAGFTTPPGSSGPSSSSSSSRSLGLLGDERRPQDPDADLLFGGPREGVGDALTIGELIDEFVEQVMDEYLLDPVLRGLSGAGGRQVG
jgi:hypothetical protein